MEKVNTSRHRLSRTHPPQTARMVDRFNRRVSDVLKSIHFESQQALTEAMHGYVNHYNRRQPQTALGGLTPSGYSNQDRRTGAKR